MPRMLPENVGFAVFYPKSIPKICLKTQYIQIRFIISLTVPDLQILQPEQA